MFIFNIYYTLINLQIIFTMENLDQIFMSKMFSALIEHCVGLISVDYINWARVLFSSVATAHSFREENSYEDVHLTRTKLQKKRVSE